MPKRELRSSGAMCWLLGPMEVLGRDEGAGQHLPKAAKPLVKMALWAFLKFRNHNGVGGCFTTLVLATWWQHFFTCPSLLQDGRVESPYQPGLQGMDGCFSLDLLPQVGGGEDLPSQQGSLQSLAGSRAAGCKSLAGCLRLHHCINSLPSSSLPLLPYPLLKCLE